MRKYKKEILLLLLACAVMLILAEVVMRYGLNWQPGFYRQNANIKLVDTLMLYHGLIADSNGIEKADPRDAQHVADYIHFLDSINFKDVFVPAESLDLSVYHSINLSLDILRGRTNNTFSEFYRKISAIPDSDRTDFQKAVVEFVCRPYNSEGFRSMPFRELKGSKKKVLLLGDSFTWGGVASVLSNSFADLLITLGYAVYNTGVTSTDPEQYRAVAQKYIAALKPDYVVVNLYTGNDISNYERPVLPGKMVYFPTNAGNLIACPQGEYFKDAKEVYDIAVEGIKIPAERSWFDWLCSKTSITSVFWGVLQKCRLEHTYSGRLEAYNKHTLPLRQKVTPCQKIISDIKSLCAANNAQFIYIQIPELRQQGHMYLPKEIPGFADTIAHAVPPLIPSDYNGLGGHFNDEGHRKYADFIVQVIDSIETARKR